MSSFSGTDVVSVDPLFHIHLICSQAFGGCGLPRGVRWRTAMWGLGADPAGASEPPQEEAAYPATGARCFLSGQLGSSLRTLLSPGASAALPSF